jgi:hypothetical protein
MKYYMWESVVHTGTSGEIVTDNPEVNERVDAAVNLIQQLLTASGLNWKHAYYWPGDLYYAYVAVDDAMAIEALTEKLGSGILRPANADDKAYKYNKTGKELTVAEYMQSE